jgi:hypothetical protein
MSIPVLSWYSLGSRLMPLACASACASSHHELSFSRASLVSGPFVMKWTRATAGSNREAVVKAAGYISHIRRIGEEKLDENGAKRYPARRMGRGTHACVAAEVSRDPGPLRQESA